LVEEMIAQLLNYLRIYLTNPLFLIPIVWVSFGCVIAWFFLSAKKHQPISAKEVEMLWKSHKHFSKCKAKKFEKISEGKKIIGYKCQCGYEHEQKRPIINFGIISRNS
jgi:phage gp36-like protein